MGVWGVHMGCGGVEMCECMTSAYTVGSCGPVNTYCT